MSRERRMMNSEHVRLRTGFFFVHTVCVATWLGIGIGLSSVPSFLVAGLQFALASAIIRRRVRRRDIFRGRRVAVWMNLLLVLTLGLLGDHVWAQSRMLGEKQGIHTAGNLPMLSDPFSGRSIRFEGPQPFDVTHYKLDLELPMTTGALSGKCTMTLRITSLIDSLVFHGVGLSLDTVRVDGVPKSTTMNAASETFTIKLNGVRKPGMMLHVEISYRRILDYPRPSSRQGYYYFSRSSLPDLPANLGYTMSEPSDARFWMPCYDEPWEKATAELNITVPSGYVAASNGKLLGITQNQDGTQTWRWREGHQIAPYLMCVTVSAFALSTIPYVSMSGDTIPIQYYVWNKEPFLDSAAAAAYLPTVRQMVTAFSRAYGSYPFDKYGMTAVVPFGYGGMEHQTLTTLNRYLFTDEKVVSHELAHQWWGDLVTCGTWSDIWLNESFATYSEAIWQESLGGFTSLKTYMKNDLEQFNLFSWSGAVYDPEGQGFNLFDPLVYTKGAWVLHTLRGVLGDSTFFRALLAYRERFAGKAATTNEFKAVVDSVAGRDMGWFFNQWIFGRGWPQYASQFSSAADTLVLTVYQQQNASLPTYTMPIQVRAYRGSNSTTFVVWDSMRTQQFKVALGYVPDSVTLDPDGWILKQIVSPPAGVAGGETPTSFSLTQNYPNPFNPITKIQFSVPAGIRHVVSLQVFDILGQLVATLVDEPKAAGEYSVSFDASNLSSGVYIYRLSLGLLTISKKMVIVK